MVSILLYLRGWNSQAYLQIPFIKQIPSCPIVKFSSHIYCVNFLFMISADILYYADIKQGSEGNQGTTVFLSFTDFFFFRLHLHNIEKLNKGESDAVSKFGFPGATCCGYISLKNEWKDNWMVIDRLQLCYLRLFILCCSWNIWKTARILNL